MLLVAAHKSVKSVFAVLAILTVRQNFLLGAGATKTLNTLCNDDFLPRSDSDFALPRFEVEQNLIVFK